MKFADLKPKSATDLKVLYEEQQLKLGNLIGKMRERQLKNVREIRKTKRIIAQILTLLNRKWQL